jgi:hypothetical protein
VTWSESIAVEALPGTEEARWAWKWLAGALVAVTAAFAIPVSMCAATGAAGATGSPQGSGLSHWLGTWSGEMTQTPAPGPSDPQNPYQITFSVNSLTTKKVGNVSYPQWECSGKLKRVKATASTLTLKEVIKTPGPFGCEGEGVTVQWTGNGTATWTGTVGGISETGTVTKG